MHAAALGLTSLSTAKVRMAMSRILLIICIVLSLMSIRTATAEASLTPTDSAGARIITFDAPHAGTGAGQGTTPIGIVQGGWIMGSYIDSSNVSHGFLRAPDGTITKFDAPGAGASAGQGTLDVWGMNPELEIVGVYLDASNVYHCFLRTPFGNFTTIDAPDAGTAAGQGTDCESVNFVGVIQGDYQDSNGTYHGFVRDRDGTFTTFDAPGSPSGPGQGIYPAIFSGINREGATIGEFLDENYVWHGYLRTPNGTIVQIDNPNAGASAFQGTGTTGINPAGEINGWYIDADNVFHGYLISPRGGVVTPVEVPGSGTGAYQGTDACEFMACYGGINAWGTIAGFYVDQNSTYHGYLRAAQGQVVTFDVSGATAGNFQGTLPLNINPEGEVTGWYVDPNGVYHGFVRIPEPEERDER
jgi:hypothetical protein